MKHLLPITTKKRLLETDLKKKSQIDHATNRDRTD